MYFCNKTILTLFWYLQGLSEGAQIEDIESQLELLHREGHKITHITTDDSQEIGEDEMIELHIQEDSEDPNSFHGFEVDVQAEETIDAGAVYNSDDSDYKPPNKLKSISEEQNGVDDSDNTSALLEAAALAEQGLSTDRKFFNNTCSIYTL